MLSLDINTTLEGGFGLDVRFTVEAGITVLFGPSGSGKSTTLAAIAGILSPKRGRIQIGEQVVFDSANNINVPIQRRAVGMVFQNLALFEHLTVIKNVMYGLAQKPRSERIERAREMLTRFGIAHLEKRLPGQLSGGERQRVALARALVTDPKALLLDEPLSALDAAAKTIIMDDLRRIARTIPIPILVVTHDRSEATALGQSMLVYEHGHIVASGSPLAVLGAPRTLSVASLAGIENIFAGQIAVPHPERGTMSVGIDRVTVEVPYSGQTAGETVHIAISARDILLATEEPHATSARNILAGTVSELQEQDLNLYVKVDCGITLIALITKHAAEQLSIRQGQPIWLAFKAHSCYLLDVE
jgi:molybdate transport system ATP-binding protein